MKHCRTRTFTYFSFVCSYFLCVELLISQSTRGAAAEAIFLLIFHHSLLNRLQRNGSIIITSDFKKCLLTTFLTNPNIATSNLQKNATYATGYPQECLQFGTEPLVQVRPNTQDHILEIFHSKTHLNYLSIL